jgi:uncharacterized YccA/Bax inhibitor family protein
MLRSANPALKGDVFRSEARVQAFGTEAMTVQGTATKSLILVGLMIAAAAYTWQQFFAGNVAAVMPLTMVGVFGGLIVALVTTFKHSWSPVLAPVYAVFEGLALGALSAMMEMRFPGIAIQAVGLTMAVFAMLLVFYKTGVITASDRFKRGVFAATGGIMLVYLVQMILHLFHVDIPMIHSSGPLGIAVSVAVSAVAALNLVIDFDFIEQGARSRAPKYMEWYGAFALLVTLVCLYMELIRLLGKLKSRD